MYKDMFLCVSSFVSTPVVDLQTHMYTYIYTHIHTHIHADTHARLCTYTHMRMRVSCLHRYEGCHVVLPFLGQRTWSSVLG